MFDNTKRTHSAWFVRPRAVAAGRAVSSTDDSRAGAGNRSGSEIHLRGQSGKQGQYRSVEIGRQDGYTARDSQGSHRGGSRRGQRFAAGATWRGGGAEIARRDAQTQADAKVGRRRCRRQFNRLGRTTARSGRARHKSEVRISKFEFRDRCEAGVRESGLDLAIFHRSADLRLGAVDRHHAGRRESASSACRWRSFRRSRRRRFR